jgi:hypothetical protein
MSWALLTFTWHVNDHIDIDVHKARYPFVVHTEFVVRPAPYVLSDVV